MNQLLVNHTLDDYYEPATLWLVPEACTKMTHAQEPGTSLWHRKKKLAQDSMPHAQEKFLVLVFGTRYLSMCHLYLFSISLAILWN